MCDPVTAIALTAMVIGTGVSTYSSVEASSNAKKAEQMKQRQAEVAAQRERTQQIRQARIKRAQILQSAANQGASDSSSAVSGASGVMSQAYGNIQYINDQEMLGKSVSSAQQKIYDNQGDAALGQGISAIGGTVFANRDEIGDIFGSKTPKGEAGTHGYEVFGKQ